jgi:hypothetical protein
MTRGHWTDGEGWRPGACLRKRGEFRKRCAGDLHVRFAEGAQETGDARPKRLLATPLETVNTWETPELTAPATALDSTRNSSFVLSNGQ